MTGFSCFSKISVLKILASELEGLSINLKIIDISELMKTLLSEISNNFRMMLL